MALGYLVNLLVEVEDDGNDHDDGDEEDVGAEELVDDVAVDAPQPRFAPLGKPLQGTE